MSENPQSSVTPPVMTSDAVWQLIEGKVKERLLFLKVAIGIIATIVSFFVSIIVWLLSDREIRQHLVSTYIFDVASQLEKPEGTKALDKYMQQTLAYTSSARLQLGAGHGRRNEDALPFYKTESDRGRLMCTATYPNNSIKNTITAQWNDLGSKADFIFEHANGNIARLDAIVPIAKNDLFGPQTFATTNQKIRFRIADTPYFDKGTPDVSIDCTMLIVGRARFSESLE
jgi:hypothetical protein